MLSFLACNKEDKVIKENAEKAKNIARREHLYDVLIRNDYYKNNFTDEQIYQIIDTSNTLKNAVLFDSVSYNPRGDNFHIFLNDTANYEKAEYVVSGGSVLAVLNPNRHMEYKKLVIKENYGFIADYLYKYLYLEKNLNKINLPEEDLDSASVVELKTKIDVLKAPKGFFDLDTVIINKDSSIVRGYVFEGGEKIDLEAIIKDKELKRIIYLKESKDLKPELDELFFKLDEVYRSVFGNYLGNFSKKELREIEKTSKNMIFDLYNKYFYEQYGDTSNVKIIRGRPVVKGEDVASMGFSIFTKDDELIRIIQFLFDSDAKLVSTYVDNKRIDYSYMNKELEK